MFRKLFDQLESMMSDRGDWELALRNYATLCCKLWKCNGIDTVRFFSIVRELRKFILFKWIGSAKFSSCFYGMEPLCWKPTVSESCSFLESENTWQANLKKDDCQGNWVRHSQNPDPRLPELKIWKQIILGHIWLISIWSFIIIIKSGDAGKRRTAHSKSAHHLLL